MTDLDMEFLFPDLSLPDTLPLTDRLSLEGTGDIEVPLRPTPSEIDFGVDTESAGQFGPTNTGLSQDFQVLDTQTNQVVPFSSLTPEEQSEVRSDPEFVDQFGETANLSGTAGENAILPDESQIFGPETTTSSGGFSGASLGRTLGLLAALGVPLTGLAGIVQTLTRGRPRETTTESSKFATPEQRQAVLDALKQLTQLSATGTADLEKSLPTDSAAPFEDFSKKLLGAQTLPDLIGQQSGILKLLNELAPTLAKGGLPITPELSKTVETAFTPVLGDIARQAIEQARRQGFAGGAELLNQAPAAALAGPALAEVQGQEAAAKLDIAKLLPVLLARISSAFTQPIAAQGALTQRALEDVAGGKQTDFENQLNLFRTKLAAPLSILRGESLGPIRSHTTRRPAPTLLDIFNPLAQVLRSVSGITSAFGMSGNQQNTLSGN